MHLVWSIRTVMPHHTTGISAADRATTILVAVDPASRPQDLARPGHIFPLRAKDGGVLVSTVDLARAAKHRAGMGFFRDRRPQLYSRICQDI